MGLHTKATLGNVHRSNLIRLSNPVIRVKVKGLGGIAGAGHLDTIRVLRSDVSCSGSKCTVEVRPDPPSKPS